MTLSDVALPADGTYTIAVKAAAGHLASTGNYVVAAYDVTPNVQSLNVNQMTTGTVATPYSTDEWTFSASANTQVQFDLLATSASGLGLHPDRAERIQRVLEPHGQLDARHPSDGRNIHADRQGTGGATRQILVRDGSNHADVPALDTPYSGTFAGSGQPQLFVVNLPSRLALVLNLNDASSGRPCRALRQVEQPADAADDYDYGANGAGSSQSILIPSANAGTWYVLVYAESVNAPPSTFTLLANATPVVVTAVTPVEYASERRWRP